MKSYIIKETNDFYSLAQFFSENGLETSIQKTTPEGIVKMWCLEDVKTGTLVSAATLQLLSGVHTLGDLAVREDFRGQGYGKLMQELVFEEARKLGITELWGNAKVPAYYLNLGWEIVDWESAPNISLSCKTCPQRGVKCFPEIIRKKL
ncbi:MAG: GNAT family N-acetyltransferase [Firmicutes bacterium]|nr:GNAT family N-acetyltransferase [Bacillota bacterium]